ncbi:MAG: hypothetical protein AAGI48_04485 [Verrucomicrobiota bacterium]
MALGTDLFTSSRGPGFIGTIMALIVLIGFGVLYVLVFDESLQGGGKTIESVIADEAKSLNSLQSQINYSKERIDEVDGLKELESEFEQLAIRARLTSKQLEELRVSETERLAVVAELDEGHKAYKESYRKSERAAAEGETMAQLETVSGKVYEEVKITDVDAVRMQIRHRGGITGVPFEELPANLQDRFQFDAEEKQASVADEQKGRTANQIGSSIGSLKIQLTNLKHTNLEAERKIEKLEQGIDNARAAIPDMESKLVRKRQELARDTDPSRRGGISQAPQLREEIKRLQSLISQANRRIPSNGKQIDEIRDQIRERNSQIKLREEKLRELTEKLKNHSSE